MIKNKNNLIVVIGFIIGIIISATGVYAATIIGKGSDLTFSNTSSGLSSTNIQDSIDELYRYKENIDCPEGKICLKQKTSLALGDYVKMTPTKSSYTTDTSKTGYDSTQTINPQELNLWRVISINSDGTVDIVSEHVSSTAIYFQGQTGYQNLVGYLNVLASQYENSTYTKKSRYFGYNGQTEYITDTSKITSASYPWTCSTGESCNPVESQGGGDTGYIKDYNLVKDVLGTTISKIPDGNNASYFIASRYYVFSYSDGNNWDSRCVVTSGKVYSDSEAYYDSGSFFGTGYTSDHLRPILTLKSGLKYSGLGTESYPMEISVS